MLEDPKPDAPVSDGSSRRRCGLFPAVPTAGGKTSASPTPETLWMSLLGMISVQRFKCRSCGSYFRRWYRAPV